MRSQSDPDGSQSSRSVMDSPLAQFSFRLAGPFLPFVNRTNGTLVSGGRVRSYLLYVPESYDPGTPTPLVISLHGFAEWPAHQAQISHWNDLADREGFIENYQKRVAKTYPLVRFQNSVT